MTPITDLSDATLPRAASKSSPGVFPLWNSDSITSYPSGTSVGLTLVVAVVVALVVAVFPDNHAFVAVSVVTP